MTAFDSEQWIWRRAADQMYTGKASNAVRMGGRIIYLTIPTEFFAFYLDIHKKPPESLSFYLDYDGIWIFGYVHETGGREENMDLWIYKTEPEWVR